MKWTPIHDFLHGFGWRNNDKLVFCRQVEFYLKENCDFSWHEIDNELINNYYERLKSTGQHIGEFD